MTYLYIGIGGMIGALLRFLISQVVVQIWDSPFPLATFIVNIVGAFFLGLITAISHRLKEKLRLAVGTGAIGSFTTLSALSGETMLLIDHALYISAVFYMVASALGGLLAAFGGYNLGNKRNEGNAVQ